MEKEKLIEAKETLIKNAIKKIEAGEVSNDLYQIIGNALFDIERKDKDSELNKQKKELAELMSKTLSL